MLRRSFFVTCLVVLALAGCKINTINSFPAHPAQVRVLNLIPDSPGIDVVISGSPAFSNVAFEAATAYQSYNNQSTSFSVTFSGTSTVVGGFTYPLGGEQPYTLVAYGSLNAPQMTLVSEVASAPTNGNVQLSVFNASQNATSVDIYITLPGVDITTIDPTIFQVAYGGTSFNVAFAPATYQIQVTTAGTKNVIYDSGGTVYTPNIALSFITYGRGSGALVNAAVLQSKGPYNTLNTIFSRVKAINASPGTPAVDQLLGTVLLNSNITYLGVSPYTLTATGATTVNFQATATPGAIIATTSGTLSPATDNTTVVAGPPGGQVAFLLRDTNTLPVPGGDRVRFVNAAAGTNPVNASIQGVQVATGVAFGTASPYIATSAASVTVTFTDAVTGAVVATQDGVVITANQSGTIYLVGPPGGQGILPVQDN